jgi:hypothetical protein
MCYRVLSGVFEVIAVMNTVDRVGGAAAHAAARTTYFE